MRQLCKSTTLQRASDKHSRAAHAAYLVGREIHQFEPHTDCPEPRLLHSYEQSAAHGSGPLAVCAYFLCNERTVHPRINLRGFKISKHIYHETFSSKDGISSKREYRIDSADDNAVGRTSFDRGSETPHGSTNPLHAHGCRKPRTVCGAPEKQTHSGRLAE